MASLAYANRAYVNKSSKKIPIYDREKGESKIIGHIYPNEMYATFTDSDYSNTTIGVCFRNSSGKFQRGDIMRQCPYHGGESDYAYLSQQKYFHLYNCSGNSLTASKSQTINGTSCRIFTVKKSVNLYNNTTKVKALPVGTKLAFNSSTTGKTQNHRIAIKYYNTGSGWKSCKDGGWVTLEFGKGTMPSNRAIR